MTFFGYLISEGSIPYRSSIGCESMEEAVDDLKNNYILIKKAGVNTRGFSYYIIQVNRDDETAYLSDVVSRTPYSEKDIQDMIDKGVE